MKLRPLLLLLPAMGQAQFMFATNADNTITITGYTGTNAEVVIPATTNGYPVTGIGPYAFAAGGFPMGNLLTNVTSIESGAFGGCAGLSSLTIPNNTTNIGSFNITGTSNHNHYGGSQLECGGLAAGANEHAHERHGLFQRSAVDEYPGRFYRLCSP
jgi:hypothetical protein